MVLQTWQPGGTAARSAPNRHRSGRLIALSSLVAVAVLVGAMGLPARTLSVRGSEPATPADVPSFRQSGCVDDVKDPTVTVVVAAGDAASEADLDVIARALAVRAWLVSIGDCAVMRLSSGQFAIEMERLDPAAELTASELGALMTSVGFVEFIDTVGDRIERGRTVRTTLDEPDSGSPVASPRGYETVLTDRDLEDVYRLSEGHPYYILVVRTTEDGYARLGRFNSRGSDKVFTVAVDKIAVYSEHSEDAIPREFVLRGMDLSTVASLAAFLSSGPLPKLLHLESVEMPDVA